MSNEKLVFLRYLCVGLVCANMLFGIVFAQDMTHNQFIAYTKAV